MKLYLVHFDTLNGIWSILHLYQLNLDESNKIAMVAFVIFFILQAVFNVVLIVSNFFFDFPCHKKESRRMMIAKFVIALVLEMPMLTCQAHVMRNMNDLDWSNLNWDVSMHLQFIIKIFVFVSVCLLYTSPSPRDKRQSRMPSSA